MLEMVFFMKTPMMNAYLRLLDQFSGVRCDMVQTGPLAQLRVDPLNLTLGSYEDTHGHLNNTEEPMIIFRVPDPEAAASQAVGVLKEFGFGSNVADGPPPFEASMKVVSIMGMAWFRLAFCHKP